MYDANAIIYMFEDVIRVLALNFMNFTELIPAIARFVMYFVRF